MPPSDVSWGMANERDISKHECPTTPAPPCPGIPDDAPQTLADIARALDILTGGRRR